MGFAFIQKNERRQRLRPGLKRGGAVAKSRRSLAGISSSGPPEIIWRPLEIIWRPLEPPWRPLEPIWSPKLNISLVFTTKAHIELQKPQFLHAFVNLGPLNLTIIPLFTYHTPLFENVRKHQFLHAFVQRPKTSLFTLLWSTPQTPSPWLGLI